VSADSSGVGPIGRTVAERLQELRTARGLTKQALAAATLREGRHIPPLGIARIEAGTRRVDVDDLCALARALDVSIVRLMEAERCPSCLGAPPVGFTCQKCGEEGR
jgi:transcriptional regulator with XRE-family HTH domain